MEGLPLRTPRLPRPSKLQPEIRKVFTSGSPLVRKVDESQRIEFRRRKVERAVDRSRQRWSTTFDRQLFGTRGLLLADVRRFRRRRRQTVVGTNFEGASQSSESHL